MVYIIPGKPIPLQRPRFNPNGSRPWDSQKVLKNKVAYIISAQNRLKLLYAGPLELEINFYFPLPKKNAYKNSWHISRPDLSNLIKFVEDVAQGILFGEDSIICSIVAKKLYSDKPRTEFIIRELIS